MIPTAYLTSDKKHLIFADSEIIKKHGFAGMMPLYSQKEILNHGSLLNQWQPIETYDVYKHPENVLLFCTTLERTNHKTTEPFIIEGWLDRDNEWQCDLCWIVDGLKPTHWQLLPQPPTQ